MTGWNGDNMKIKEITITVKPNTGGGLVNVEARDDSGRLRGDLTTCDPADVQKFVREWQEAAELVKVDIEDLTAYPVVLTPDGYQYTFAMAEGDQPTLF